MRVSLFQTLRSHSTLYRYTSASAVGTCTATLSRAAGPEWVRLALFTTTLFCSKKHRSVDESRMVHVQLPDTREWSATHESSSGGSCDQPDTPRE
jgi:hypothetical protein